MHWYLDRCVFNGTSFWIVEIVVGDKMKTLMMLGFINISSAFINLSSAEDKLKVWPWQPCDTNCVAVPNSVDRFVDPDNGDIIESQRCTGWKQRHTIGTLLHKDQKFLDHYDESMMQMQRQKNLAQCEPAEKKEMKDNISDADYKKLWEEFEAWQLQDIIDHTNPDGTVSRYSQGKKGDKYGYLWKKLEPESREAWHNYFVTKINYVELQRIASDNAKKNEANRQDQIHKYDGQFTPQDRNASTISQY